MDKPVIELAAIEGIIAAIGPGMRYKDLADFWENAEHAKAMVGTTEYEGIPFDVLSKVLPELEKRLGVELKTHKIGRMQGPEQVQSIPKS